MNKYLKTRNLIAPYKSLISGERFLNHNVRLKYKKWGLVICSILLAASLLVAQIYVQVAYLLFGFMCVFSVLTIFLYMLEAFFYSNHDFLEKEFFKGEVISTPLAIVLSEIIRRSDMTGRVTDVTTIFADLSYGRMIMTRLGVSSDIIAPASPVDAAKVSVTLEDIENDPHFESIKNLADFVCILFQHSHLLAEHLMKAEVRESDLSATAFWVEKSITKKINKERWWSKSRLKLVPGLGKEWAFGETYILEEHGRFIDAEEEEGGMSKLHRDEIDRLESALSRARAANALILGDSDVGRMSVINGLVSRISEGTSEPMLEHKKVFLFQTAHFAKPMWVAADFQYELTRVLNQAIEAGDVIFVIDNLAGFFAAAETLGVSLDPILVGYLRSSALQWVALADTNSFYGNLDKNKEILEHFEIVRLISKDTSSVIELVEEDVAPLENGYGIIFTYGAVRAIVDSAERYFSADSLIDKVGDLILEVAPAVSLEGKILVEKNDVLNLVQKKTGIKVGQIDGAEKVKLLDLERLLHQRIVGQEEAIKAISLALRRSRSGLSKTNRPLGSFLFLGPTGVGKTETSKALSDIFFGAHAPMTRIDMSEYSGGDALAKLIGDIHAQSGGGTLTKALREHQYGVLLLDEFEKASGEVHNLFLQILDEGFFSDSTGTRVNARNLIIIATSNAGGDLLTAISSGNKESIINEIIRRGTFKPELINRFDGVVLFNPLSEEDIIAITRLALAGLSQRLIEKGVDLIVTDDLVLFLIKKGYDPHFGARPLNRAVADYVEEKIAQALIKGDLNGGQKISLVPDPDKNFAELKINLI